MLWLQDIRKAALPAVAAAALLCLAGCDGAAGEQEAWQAVRRLPSMPRCVSYVQRFPQGAHTDSVRNSYAAIGQQMLRLDSMAQPGAYRNFARAVAIDSVALWALARADSLEQMR